MQNLVNKIMGKLQPKEVVAPFKDIIWEDAHLVALGKPASHYAKALSEQNSFESILSVTKSGHRVDAGFDQWEGTHPKPSLENLETTKKLQDYLKAKKRVVFLISGGASSLLVKPKIDWDVFIKIWDAMLLGGWGIEEMNKVRILVSHIKGGGLVAPATQNLYISDVPSHHFSLVSSSPTNPVSLDKKEMIKIIKRLPEFESVLAECLDMYIPPVQKNVENHLLLSGDVFRDKVCSLMQQEYPEYEIIPDQKMASEDLETFIARIPRLKSKQIWVSVGEAAVTVSKSEGVGGRNSHLVVRMQQELSKGEVFLSLATDGSDGNSASAGGFVEFQSIDTVKTKPSLESFDTARLLESENFSFHITPGLTNLMDLRIKICH